MFVLVTAICVMIRIYFTVKLDREPRKSWRVKDRQERQRNRPDKTAITAFLTIDHLDEVCRVIVVKTRIDGGWYVCIAVNGGGRVRSLMYLDITDLCEGAYRYHVPDQTKLKTLSKAYRYLVPDQIKLKTLSKAYRYLVPDQIKLKNLSKAKRYLVPDSYIGNSQVLLG
eukprot:sb/3472304/